MKTLIIYFLLDTFNYFMQRHILRIEHIIVKFKIFQIFCLSQRHLLIVLQTIFLEKIKIINRVI